MSSQSIYAAMVLIIGLCLDKNIYENENMRAATQWEWEIHQKYEMKVIYNCGSHYFFATLNRATLDKRAVDDSEVWN